MGNLFTAALIGEGTGATNIVEGNPLDGFFESTDTTVQRIDAAPEGDLERAARKRQLKDFGALGDLVDAGPGESDVSSALDASRDFARKLEAAAQSGNLPTELDITRSRGFAQDIFAGEQAALDNLFQDEETEAARLAAQLGRPVDDPVLRAKLAQTKARQTSALQGRITSAATNLALQQPTQRLNFAGQRAQVLQGLSDQAKQNRVALASLGSQIQAQQSNTRLAFADKITNTTDRQSGFDTLLQGIAGVGQIASLAVGGIGGAAGAAGAAGAGGAGAAISSAAAATPLPSMPSFGASPTAFQAPTFGVTGPAYGAQSPYSVGGQGLFSGFNQFTGF